MQIEAPAEREIIIKCRAPDLVEIYYKVQMDIKYQGGHFDGFDGATLYQVE